MNLSEFDFELPPELIAQEPLPRRDQSRLLHVDGRAGSIAHHQVSGLPELLRRDDVLVVNNSRVFPARLSGDTETGASIEVLLLRQLEGKRWEVLARPARRLGLGTEVRLGNGSLRAKVVASSDYGRRTVEFLSPGDLLETVERFGKTPLPPYIKRDRDELEPKDRQRYQTVYARERGSVAAPTAGLHFTPELLQALKAKGVVYTELTLHVGYGTFQPIRTDVVEDHRMDSELYVIPEALVADIEMARSRGGRVVAVGTTTVRALESASGEKGAVRPGSDETRLFICPGYRFRVVDVLLTNFHLPRSSLFVLVSAFGGVELVKRAYEEAIRERYRFYSYGDCMLVSS